MTWRRIDLDKNRKQLQKRKIERTNVKSSVDKIKCRITKVYLPGELSGFIDQDNRLDLNTYRVQLLPIDISNSGYVKEFAETVFVINEEPHYVTANYGVLGLKDKIVTLEFTSPHISLNSRVSLEGIMSYGQNLNEPPREETLDSKAFDIGQIILGLIPF